jgi:hypothetical protein
MSSQQTNPDEQRRVVSARRRFATAESSVASPAPTELFEGLIPPEEFRDIAKPGKRPPTLRTIYRWMDRGMVAWVQWGDQRLIDVAATRGLLLARVRRPDRERRRRKR